MKEIFVALLNNAAFLSAAELIVVYFLGTAIMYLIGYMRRGKRKSGSAFERFCDKCDSIEYSREIRGYYLKWHLVPAIAIIADIVLWVLSFKESIPLETQNTTLTIALILTALLILYYMYTLFFVDGGWHLFKMDTAHMHENYRDPEFETVTYYTYWDYETDPTKNYISKESYERDKNLEHNAFAAFLNFISLIFKILLAIGLALCHAVYYFLAVINKLFFDVFSTSRKRKKAKKYFKKFLKNTVSKEFVDIGHGYFTLPFFTVEYDDCNEIAEELVEEFIDETNGDIMDQKENTWFCAKMADTDYYVVAYVKEFICEGPHADDAMCYIYEGLYGKLAITFYFDDEDGRLFGVVALPDDLPRDMAIEISRSESHQDIYRRIMYYYLSEIAETHKPDFVVTAWDFDRRVPKSCKVMIGDIVFYDDDEDYEITATLED